MIYLRRLPRVLMMLTLALGLLAVGGFIFLVNIVYSGFTADTWNEALARMDRRVEEDVRR